MTASLSSLPDWLENHPEMRVLALVLLIGLFGWVFFRLSRGAGKSVYLLLSAGLATLFWFSPLAALLAGLLLIAGLYLFWRPGYTQREQYQSARVVAEGGGIKRGLTAPEAAMLLGMPQDRVTTAVLLGLLRKGVLQVRENASLTVEVGPHFRSREVSPQARLRAAHRRAVAHREGVVLHPYEEPFIELLEEQGGQPLNSVDFSAPLRVLKGYMEPRIRGYDREATQDYYRKHLGRARHDVIRIGNGASSRRLMDHHLEWLLLDGSYASLYRQYRPDWVPAGETGVESLAAKVMNALNSK